MSQDTFCNYCRIETGSIEDDCVVCGLSKPHHVNDEQKWRDEKTSLANRLYAEIFPVLSRYESRGFNAHQRTQCIVSEVIAQGETWVLQNVRGK